MPRQQMRPVSEGESGIWLEDQDFYQSFEAYPLTYSPSISTHFMNGSGIALSAFIPVRYVPATGQVSYYSTVTVTVRTGPDPDAGQRKARFYPSPGNMSRLAGHVQNPEGIALYLTGRELRTSGYDYLVVTKNQYINDLDTLIRFYKPRGILTKTTATEYIDTAMTGIDLQEKIRNYIIQEYEDHGIGYVLIGGDAEVVPYRGFYCYVESGSGYSDSNIPADLYYSALDGTWNDDGDELWGEPGEEDLFPEVAIGRLTFSTSAELQRMLHKSFSYQGNPVLGELTHPLLAGEHLWSDPLTWGSDYMRLLVGLRTDHGYTTQGIPPSQPIDSLYDSYQSWSKADLMNKINSGKPWVHHCGHASYTYVMKLGNSDITNTNFAGANGITHNFTIVYTHGCNCGGFDQTDCIGEKMIGIDNFAVAFIGNSRFGWFVEGTTDGPSQHLHREFMDAIYGDSLYRLGMAVMQSKIETAPFVDLPDEYEPGATRWCFYDNNLLGDPMLAAWTEEPWEISAQYPRLIPINASSMTVQLTGPFGPCKDFSCSLYRNDTLFGAAFSDPDGMAVIPVDHSLAEGPIALVISGYNILPHYFGVNVSDYWLGNTADWNDPVNWFTGAVPDSSTYLIIPSAPAGTKYPLTNSGPARVCHSILVEPGAVFIIQPGDVMHISND